MAMLIIEEEYYNVWVCCQLRPYIYICQEVAELYVCIGVDGRMLLSSALTSDEDFMKFRSSLPCYLSLFIQPFCTQCMHIYLLSSTFYV